MRLGYYAAASTAAAAACLLKAFHERPNFYSATVYLSHSSACLLIITNLCLVAACSFIYGLQRMLYGPLRPIEIEQLSEKAWYAVLDTLLAMPSFREEVGGWLLCMFVLLLAGKVWGWIGEGRVDILEQGQPQSGNPRLWHARLATSLVISVVFDMWMLDYCVESVMADPRPGMMVIFTFEFAVLSVFSMFTLSRYLLSLIQQRIERKQMAEAIEARKNEVRAERAAARQNETAEGRPAPASPPNEEPIEVDENEVDVPGWEDKRRYLFALEVFTDFVKLLIYIIFFTVSITFNGLPMHVMRDVYMTLASFSKRVSDYVAYRKATSDMNTRYPDATTEEIRGDACIVCRESMVAWEQPANAAQGQSQGAAQPPQSRRDEGLRAKKLPCNHILHLRCLKAWLERQQVCPTCRRPVIQPEMQPGQSDQAGAGNGAGAAAQQGQAGPPRQRQNRARIFNLGPVRIGFLNGPNDQIQNIVNQMRNPQAQVDQAQAAAAGQQGPNHLGLQVPYLPGAGGQAQGGIVATGGPRAQVPTQIQMVQLEQRLLQDAHNLGIEQQQLGTLRLMEQELARLRTQHMPGQPPVGTLTAAQRAQQVPNPFVQPYWTAPQALTGSLQQQYGPGHEMLPQGMVLPRGWTVMPLRQAEAGGEAVPQAQSAQPPIQTTTNGPVAHETMNAQPNLAAPLAERGVADGVPRNENGSPFFVPTATAEPAARSSQATAAATQPEPTPTPTQASSSQPQPETKAPWQANEGWSFVKRGNGTSDSNGVNMTHTQQPSDSQYQPTSGKGKGRAVEVEDAPDES